MEKSFQLKWVMKTLKVQPLIEKWISSRFIIYILQMTMERNNAPADISSIVKLRPWWRHSRNMIGHHIGSVMLQVSGGRL